MANEVLKDKDGNILNPKIPRYEKIDIAVGKETATNIYIDDKRVFIREINVGNLKNQTVNDVNLSELGISFDKVVAYSCYAIENNSMLYNLNPAWITMGGVTQYRCMIFDDSGTTKLRIAKADNVTITNLNAKVIISYTK